MIIDTPLRVHVEKRSEHFRKVYNPDGSASGVGTFSLHLEVTATQKDVYIPLSVASGKKPAGFVYQIEGTGESSISTTNITSRGDAITQILVGTITYCKIPFGKTAFIHIHIEMGGKVGKEYTVVINRIHYKLDPSEARYQNYTEALRTGALKFH